MSYYNRTRPALLINRFTSDVEAVRAGVQNVVFASLVNLGSMLVAAGFIMAYDRQLFLLLLATAPILWGLNRIFRTRLSQVHRAVQESFSRVTATVSESVRGVRVTQSFNRWARNAQMFHDLVFDHSWFNVRVTQTESLYLPLMDLNSQFFLAALLILGGYRVLYGVGTTTLSDLVQFFFLAGTFFNPIQALANHYNQALTAMASAERLFRFLDTPPDWPEPPAEGRSPVTEGRVELDHVSFAYGPHRTVLHDLCLSLKPGLSVALVGPTGRERQDHPDPFDRQIFHSDSLEPCSTTSGLAGRRPRNRKFGRRRGDWTASTFSRRCRRGSGHGWENRAPPSLGERWGYGSQQKEKGSWGGVGVIGSRHAEALPLCYGHFTQLEPCDEDSHFPHRRREYPLYAHLQGWWQKRRPWP